MGLGQGQGSGKLGGGLDGSQGAWTSASIGVGGDSKFPPGPGFFSAFVGEGRLFRITNMEFKCSAGERG